MDPIHAPGAAPGLLLTGFEPFAHHVINPSWVATERAAREYPARVVGHCLPVHHHRARERLIELIEQVKPRAVMAMGLAAGDEFRIECVARKVVEFAELSGSVEHQITLDRDVLAEALGRQGVPWRFSEDAGRYVCESTYWAVLEYLSERSPPVPCAFLHVPADSPSWPAARTSDVVVRVVGDLLEAI